MRQVAGKEEACREEIMRGYVLGAIGSVLLAAGLAAGPVAQAYEEVEVRRYSSGVTPPSGVAYETKSSWEFDDERLVFKHLSSNSDGKRYFEWKDYYWGVDESSITIYDPRANGTTLTVARHQADSDGDLISDKDIMNQLREDAEDIREDSGELVTYEGNSAPVTYEATTVHYPYYYRHYSYPTYRYRYYYPYGYRYHYHYPYSYRYYRHYPYHHYRTYRYSDRPRFGFGFRFSN